MPGADKLRIAADNLRLGISVVADSCNPIELTRDELTFHLEDNQEGPVVVLEKNRGYLEELVRRLFGREVTVGVKVIHDASTK